ncbi:major facilitator superfamily domain-containing protein [Dipodascopsis uninucleata]
MVDYGAISEKSPLVEVSSASVSYEASDQSSTLVKTESAGSTKLTEDVDNGVNTLESHRDLFMKYGNLQELIEKGPSSWTEEEDRKVRIKTDIRVMAFACLMFMCLQLDRINIVNVLTTNFQMDLGMQPNDYNLGQTVFVTCFLISEIPINMLTTIIGPTIWIPTMMTCWGVVAMCQTFITGKASYLVTRGLLGSLEGGFVSSLVTYVTGFYKSNEMSVRLSMLFTTLYLTNVLSALLANAIFLLDGVHNWHNWQWLFLLEGLATSLFGIFTFFAMPSLHSPSISRIFTAREQDILRARVILDDPSKAQVLEQNRNVHLQSFGLRDVLSVLSDKYLMPVFLLGWLGFVPSVCSYQFMTIIYRSIGFNTTQANLLTIPANILLIITMVNIARLADKYRSRWWTPIVAMLWLLPLLIILVAIPETAPVAIRVVCTIFIVGFPYFTPIMFSWVSANANDQHRRSIGLAIYNIMVQFGNITSSNVYRADDAPYYRRGNSILIGITIFNILVATGTRWYFVRENERRTKIWDAMTAEEKRDYELNTTDLANNRLDFILKI